MCRKDKKTPFINKVEWMNQNVTHILKFFINCLKYGMQTAKKQILKRWFTRTAGRILPGGRARDGCKIDAGMIDIQKR